MTEMFKNLIAGEWVSAGNASRNINPSNTNDVVGEYAQGAVEAARTTPSPPPRRPSRPGAAAAPQERYDILKKASDEILARKEELGRLLSREEGKTLPEGIGEAGRAGQIFAFFAGECLRLSGEMVASVRPGVDVEMTREPVGVVGMITPWNFPIAIPAWKIAPALAYGNCVVFKPADLVPGSAWALVDIIQRAGLPKGVFNLVMGRGSVVGQALLEHKDVDAISFTGSVATGRKVARGLHRLVADEEGPARDGRQEPAGRARRRRPQDRGRSGRQRRLLLHRPALHGLLAPDRQAGIHDRFVEACIERLKGLVVDDALKAGTHIGPVVDQSQLDQDLNYIEIAKDEGGKLAWGGELLNRETPGFYLQPALFTETTNDMRITREEVFGPVANVIRVKDYDEALAVANDTEFGLSSGICTTSPEARHAFQAQRRGRHGDGQPADGGRRLPRAVRRPEGLELRPARAGRLRRGVLHHGEDGLHAGLRSDIAILEDRRVIARAMEDVDYLRPRSLAPIKYEIRRHRVVSCAYPGLAALPRRHGPSVRIMSSGPRTPRESPARNCAAHVDFPALCNAAISRQISVSLDCEVDAHHSAAWRAIASYLAMSLGENLLTIDDTLRPVFGPSANSRVQC